MASAIILCSLVLIIPLARADQTTESFIVYTDKQYYTVGDLVTIYVKANSIDTNSTITVTDVTVYDPNNSSVAQWNNLSIVLNDTTTPELIGTLNATTEGTYTVDATAIGCLWIFKCWCWFYCLFRPWKVIPECPLGAIAAMTALLGTTGLYVRGKKHRMKK